MLIVWNYQSVMLYSSRDKVDLEKENEITSVDANSYSAFKIVDSLVVKRVTDELDALGEPEDEGLNKSTGNRFYLSQVLFAVPSDLVGSLAKALCCRRMNVVSWIFTYTNSLDINRITSPSLTPASTAEEPPVLQDPRVLILSVSPDLSTSYIPIMNSIFSAQKLVGI